MSILLIRPVHLAAEAPQSALTGNQYYSDQQHIPGSPCSFAAPCCSAAALLCCHAFLESGGTGR